MASILKVDDLRGNTSAGDITITSEGGAATQSLQQGLLKAWCSWSQTDTGNPYDTLNISSITDTSTVINVLSYSSSFSTVAGQCPTATQNGTSSSRNDQSSSDLQAYNPSTNSINVISKSNANPAYCNVHTAGDLA